MPNILFVTDNEFILEQLQVLIKGFDVDQEDVDFACSPENKFVKRDESVNVVDVKDQITHLLNKYDFIISAHCKQFFPKELVQNVVCINIHPGYNPLNRGWFPQVFALNYNFDVGATIHIMDDKLDHGPILARKKVKKYPWDTSESLYNRIIKKELQLFKDVFPKIISGSIQPEKTEKEEEHFFSKSDFNNLCRIDMQEKGRFEDFYNRLRALTHGKYKNAYFIDEQTNKKIYVSINVEIEDL